MRVGVDVGGTSIRARLFHGDETTHIEAPTCADGGEAVAERIASTIEALLAVAGGNRPHGIGVGIPGLVDPVAGTIRHAVNLGIDGNPVALGSILTARFDIPVAIENDVRAAALGVHDHLRAQGEEVSDLVFLSVGTGISAGVIIDGRLHRGRHGLAGEIGHAPLAGVDLSCRCGLVGCLEAIAGGQAIRAATGTDAEHLFSDGSRSADAAGTVAFALARALRVLATAYDPDLFVLGGGIGPHAAPAVRKALVELSAASPFGAVVLTPDRVVTLPPDAEVGTRGAALLAPPAPTTVISATTETQQGGNRP